MLSNPHFRRTIALAGTTAGLIGYIVQKQQAEKKEEAALATLTRRSDADLAATWARSTVAMVNAPGCEALNSADDLVYLAPVADDLPAAPVAWPKIFAKSVIFSITASNPMGFQVPPEANLAANAALEEDIRNMQRPCTPRAWWRSFAFDATEGLQPREQADREGASWREDVSLRCRRTPLLRPPETLPSSREPHLRRWPHSQGVSVAFATEEFGFARASILNLAHKHKQAAVVAYRVKGGALVRETLWLDPKKQQAHGAEQEVTLVRAARGS